MKIVQQKKSGCVPTSIFMLNNNKDFKKIKKLCKKKLGYSHSQSNGCTFNNPINAKEFLSVVGFEVVGEAKEGESLNSINDILKYNRGLVLITKISKAGEFGHCMAWDGARIFDPQHGTIMSEHDISSVYGNDILYDVYAIKTPLCNRIYNVIRKHIYETLRIILRILGR